jgi:hypothetical protein
MIRTVPRLVACSLALVAASPAAAEEDFQPWFAATATVPVGERALVWLEGQARTSDDASRLNQVLLRPAVGLRVSPAATLFAGYAFVATNPRGPGSSKEHRIWQQALIRILGDGKGITLSSRSRLEQRFREDDGDTGHRLRQLVRLTAPIGSAGTQAVIWSEPFIGLNGTAWGQPAGLDRWRNFVGVSVPVAATLRVEPGYMNEVVEQRGPDRMNHIASLTLNLSL